VSDSTPREAPEARFAADWLRVRELADHRSRAHELVESFLAWWRLRSAEEARPLIRVVDLGAGTGSNLRYLAPRLPGPQAWTLVDHDAELLARADAPDVPGLQVSTARADLADALGAVIGSADLVTTSALLDLCSAAWVGTLAEVAARAGAPVLAALTYDGSMRWRETDSVDEVVRRAVNSHQRRDKGLGPALGPDAGRVAMAAFGRQGFDTLLVESPWRLTPDDAPLARELVAGWCQAACEDRPDDSDRIESWAERRRARIDHGDFALTVGHLDLLALPPRARPPGGTT
jgi:SAM-dependent methyltransferase